MKILSQDDNLFQFLKVLTDQVDGSVEARRDGRDWPKNGYTMIGELRLMNIRNCIEEVVRDKVAGDFLEAGVWKGGAAMFMKACLNFYGDRERSIFLADSFMGLPPPKDLYPADKNDTHHTFKALAVSKQEVKSNFQKFNLFDDRIKFIEGWFDETLYKAPIESLAILRLDGDMYESTWITLDALYDKVADGGFIIVDDYGYIESCRKAVHDFFEKKSINPAITPIDWTGVFWRKH